MMFLEDSHKFFKMTVKTRVFLWLHERFHGLGQWFIHHCDYEDVDYDEVTRILIEDSQWKPIAVEKVLGKS